ncbi:hypothetical protein IHE45_05G128100 [Dioscorea alata]|uniref:Uncharacterized protein n=4 Tax=Dioscorea alata TaxID=55571 RepID=A0ACB7W512_DIOAL|nr:hypothetical protein IHE45_05G128100 [Dioscorea alata]KAH7682539.1 hypothetical protein IHE45_05G128100 [Dioscorea alata]KAH7682540.1 hypothetical protein IHE45_05G128100 [Dioscorea alata]KAH7682541.1 hypothetical protein IHE45_05G128100 [Dioscorea alata]
MARHHWANLGIMAGTILGGMFGFYVMHCVEESYQNEMRRRLEKMLAQQQLEQQRIDNPKLFSDT